MCSQDNVIYISKLITKDYKSGYHSGVTYLPLNHIAALQGLYLALLCAGAQYFAPPDALRGSLLPTIKEVKEN